MRTFGVEEELLLVDEHSGQPKAVASEVLRRHDDEPTGESTAELAFELQQEMIEVVTRPHDTLPALLAEIRQGRATADRAARAEGARASALASCPVRVEPHVSLHSRYRWMTERYGVMARTTLLCGFHIHVSVESPEEGVAVLDRIRVWLPVLVALSANSPFQDGSDTGYASFRAIAWRQWPSAGPTDVFGSLAAYRDYERELINTGALLDTGMLYFDARLSHTFPTVEVRVADVCLDAADAAAIAALTRALVETAAQQWRAGVHAPARSSAAVRLASWMAARSGVHGQLADPLGGPPRGAREVVGALLDHVDAALHSSGDREFVHLEIERMLTDGTGADWQRTTFGEKTTLHDLMLLAADRTHRDDR